MNFKKLTYYSGSVVYINFNKVTAVSVNQDGRTVITYSSGECDIVKESPERIFETVSEVVW